MLAFTTEHLYLREMNLIFYAVHFMCVLIATSGFIVTSCLFSACNHIHAFPPLSWYVSLTTILNFILYSSFPLTLLHQSSEIALSSDYFLVAKMFFSSFVNLVLLCALPPSLTTLLFKKFSF